MFILHVKYFVNNSVGSKTCEEVNGTSYMVRNLQFRTLRFYWRSKKWRKNYQKCIELVMNMGGGGVEGKDLHVSYSITEPWVLKEENKLLWRLNT